MVSAVIDDAFIALVGFYQVLVIFRLLIACVTSSLDIGPHIYHQWCCVKELINVLLFPSQLFCWL